MKKYKILIPVLSFFAAASIVSAVLIPKYFGNHADQSVTVFTLADSEYTPLLSFSGTLDFPPLQTDIDNIFYTVTPDDGSVAFYEYVSARFVPYPGEIFTLETTAACSSQVIPVKLFYINQGGKITGFGLFTSSISKDPVKIYDYAFFKITQLPAGYGKSGALLLVDFNKDAFLRNEKLYTEAFTINLEKGKTTRLTTDTARTVGTTGAFRPDWIMLNDDFLENLGDKPLFLSSRDYNLEKKGYISDLLTIGDPRPSRTVTGILGLWARVTEKGITYLRSTETGFNAVLASGKTETVVKSFSGDYFNDYLCSGKYIFNKTNFVLTDLITAGEKTLENISAGASSVLSVSPNGTWAVIASTNGNGAKASQSLSICDLNTGKVKTITEPLLFSQANANFCWVDNNTLIHLRPSGDDGTGLNYCILNLTGLLGNEG